jgi:hypothetical protein
MLAHTKVLGFVTPTFALSVQITLRAMLEWLVAITNIVEEVDLVFTSK